MKAVEHVRGPGRWLSETNENTVRSVSTPPFLPWPTRHSQPDRLVGYGDVLENHTPYRTKLAPTSSKPEGWPKSAEAPRPQPETGDAGYNSLVHDMFGNAHEAHTTEVSMFQEYHPDLNKKYKNAMKTFPAYSGRVDERAKESQWDVRWGLPRHY